MSAGQPKAPALAISMAFDRLWASPRGRIRLAWALARFARRHYFRSPYPPIIAWKDIGPEDIRRAWDGLPDDLKAVLEQTCGQRLALLGGQAYDARVIEIEKKHRDDRTLVFVDAGAEDIERLRASTKPLIDAWIARTARGQKAYDIVMDTLTKLRRRERMS